MDGKGLIFEKDDKCAVKVIYDELQCETLKTWKICFQQCLLHRSLLCFLTKQCYHCADNNFIMVQQSIQPSITTISLHCYSNVDVYTLSMDIVLFMCALFCAIYTFDICYHCRLFILASMQGAIRTRDCFEIQKKKTDFIKRYRRTSKISENIRKHRKYRKYRKTWKIQTNILIVENLPVGNSFCSLFV